MPAVAFVSWGVWVADCPSPMCTNAMALEPGQTRFHCWVPSGEGTCGWEDSVTWPDDVAAVEESLAGMPPAQRNWKPEDA